MRPRRTAPDPGHPFGCSLSNLEGRAGFKRDTGPAFETGRGEVSQSEADGPPGTSSRLLACDESERTHCITWVRFFCVQKQGGALSRTPFLVCCSPPEACSLGPCGRGRAGPRGLHNRMSPYGRRYHNVVPHKEALRHGHKALSYIEA